jgi:hypothetical protein
MMAIVPNRAGGLVVAQVPVRLLRASAPGSPSDTTADLVLGQLNFIQNTANFVDGAGCG